MKWCIVNQRTKTLSSESNFGPLVILLRTVPTFVSVHTLPIMQGMV